MSARFGHAAGLDEPAILAEFGIGPGALLGQGSESRVFELPDGRVLRVMPAARDEDAFDAYLQQLRSVLEGFQTTPVGVDLPVWLESGRTGTQRWRVERRMTGSDLTGVLAGEPNASCRRQLLLEYVDVAWRLARLAVPRRTWSRVIDPPFIADSLGELLMRTVQPVWDAPGLAAHGIDAAAELERLRREYADRVCEPAFVHADYFPNNVFAAASSAEQPARMTGVGDFSVHDLVADPLMTVVGAVVFLTLVEYPGLSQDAVWLERTVVDGLSTEDQHWFDVHRRWYGLYYSMDDRLLQWCAAQFG